SASWIGFCRLTRTRITGYKRKALGDPSAKLSGDAPRAHFTNIFFSEIISPLLLIVVCLIPYLFINAQTGVNENNNPDKELEATNSLIRVGIVAFAPVAVNAGVLGGMFALACCAGPLLSMCCKKFGAVLAAIAHAIAVIMLLAFFEVMFFLEGWSFSKAVLGMITVVAIQRFVYKLIIALALTREFKADASNIAWWTGKWYAMGWHTISQPGREFLCKITELGYFAADFILGHILLFIMLPPLLVPYIDKVHSVMLFWLRPSRQIRPPIYSLKQTKLRKRRVIRYSILYFTMLIVFIALIAGPLVAGGALKLEEMKIEMQLLQPSKMENNDTRGYTKTGRTLEDPEATAGGGGIDSTESSGGGGGSATESAGADTTDSPFASDNPFPARYVMY
ncbi:hypothetical protein P152DRAFT_62809, partial [Eremomyces bilateralis CBS 781.70]